MSNESSWRERKKFVTVGSQRMAYVEMGKGRPIVFQHGNPTSSYLWRNILPHLSDLGRCIAIDLTGMGDSDKLADSGPARYTFAEHRRYWSAALQALGITRDIVFVLHDWGTALGFDWARAHPAAVAGICYMEGMVAPLTWSDWPASALELFEAFRSPAGEDLVLRNNVFIEQVLPGAMLAQLSEADMDAYRAPYRSPGEDRRPMLTWPRQLPIEGQPADVNSVVADYGGWLASSGISKLFINAEPGMILTGRLRDYARTWNNQVEVTVKGLHYVQEDSPAEITAALRAWIATFPARDVGAGG